MGTVFNTGLPESGALTLQCCPGCGQVNYPPRELCGHCLAADLQWRSVDDGGVVQATATLHYSLEEEYRQHLPWPVASVKLNCGPVVMAHLQPGVAPGIPVRVRVMRDTNGNRMLVAADESTNPGELSAWLQDIDFREISA